MRKIISRLVLLIFLFPLMLSGASCDGESEENTATQTSTSIVPITSNSDKYYIEVQLPSGWARVEGPESLVFTGYILGEVAFNNWGQKDFWAREIIEKNPDGSFKSAHFGPSEVASQVPSGGAYVALASTFNPPISLPVHNTPPETQPGYTLNDLSGLYQTHDWRQDTATYAYFKSFYKGSSWFYLQVACSENATNETVANLNDLLKSWKFIE